MTEGSQTGEGESGRELLHVYAKGVRTSLGVNAGPYAYSVTITAAFGVLTSILGSSSVSEVFLFALGAATAFAVTEVVASRGFRVRVRGERPELIVLGSAISFGSVLLAVGAAALAGEVLAVGVAWPVGSFAATVTFILVNAVELLLGQQAGRRRGVEDRSE